jgi:hypothetical protein
MPNKKVTDLRPCDNCGGKINPIFLVLRVSQAAVDAHAVNQVLGMAQIMGGSLALGELFSTQTDVIKVFGDEEPGLMTEIFICQECFYGNPLDLAGLVEQRIQKDA